MNENVRVIIKIGQVPMVTLVENAARMGFALAGSPTMISGVPAQLMVRTDVLAQEPQYALITKDAMMTMAAQVEQRLKDGWRIYGSMVTGELPSVAMIKGDIASYSIGLGASGGAGGITEAEVQILIDAAIASLPQKDWEGDFERIEQNIEEIYNVLNSMPDPTPALNKALDDAVAAGKQELQEVSDKIDKKFEQQSNQIDQIWAYVDQKYADSVSAIRGEVAGLNGQIEQLTQELQMEKSERQQDINALNARLDSLTPPAS